MAKSTGIILTAGVISFGNEWIQENKINYRIPVATLGAAFFLAGVERLNEKAGVGLAWMALILAFLTPIKGKAPAQTAVQLMKK